MALFHLVRHASHDLIGKVLTGRAPGLGLSKRGAAEAAALEQRLTDSDIVEIRSSPLERAMETARPIAQRLGLEIVPDPRLVEVDFGGWTGLPFEQLRQRPDWRRWNSFRSAGRPPGGETIAQVQARLAAALTELAERHPSGGVVLVSHGDVIRAALAYWAGVPIDLFLRIEISPASISRIALGPDGVSIIGINEQVRVLPDG